MSTRTSRAARWTVPMALALALGACGGSDSSDEAPAAGAGTRTPTVSVMQVDGFGDVLVDDRGHALYASDEEAGGEVLCMDGCKAIWDPVQAGSAAPTAGAGVTGELDVVRRGDGERQVTLAGKPLYRFTQDPGPGEVTGHDLTDSFDGMSFTWHALTPDGSAATAAAPSGAREGY